MIAASSPPTTLSPAEVSAYLDRIGFDGPAPPTVATLHAIYRGHLHWVPFENLDIVPLRRPLSLEPSALFAKIVTRRRGGFCYELNGLLGTVLRDLGYDVTIVAVQFVEADGGFSPPFDHMALVVGVPGEPHPWLVDAAGGRNSTAHPLSLVDGFTEFQEDMGRGFRLSLLGDRWQQDERVPDGDWASEYTFQVIPRRLDDFLARCRYQENDPDSYFRQGALCSLATPTGRVTLSKNRLLTTIAGVRTEREVTRDEFDDLLKRRFGIDLSDREES